MGKDKAVYAPGELSRVRNNLGSLDDGEAKRMVQLLGGEVGVEKNTEAKARPLSRAQPQARRTREEKVEVVVGGARGTTGLPRSQARRAPDSGADGQGRPSRAGGGGSGSDNPNASVKLGYWDRIKMDRQAAQPEFDIKSSSQAFISMLSIFSPPVDMVNPNFVLKRMNEYYKRLETLVSSTRMLLPRSNHRRLELLSKKAPFVFSVLEILRTWNLDKISGDLTRLQTQPRNVLASDFTEILKAVYRPLYLLEQLDTEIHIKGAFKVLYKLLYLEDPTESKDKNQDIIRSALIAYTAVRQDIHYRLYPLLLRLLSDKWLSYENFFRERKQRFLAFIGASEDDRLDPPGEMAGMGDNLSQADLEEDAPEDMENAGEAEQTEEGEDENDPAVQARRAEKKAVSRGVETLESLFPQAGWDRAAEFPDFYPYFGKMFDLSRGYEQISPHDPLHQVVVLMRTLEELFFGLRFVSFSVKAPGLEDEEDRVDETMTELINNWQLYLDRSYNKEYLPRVREYVRILESSAESRTSSYAKRILNELHWSKRLFFLPYYKFESLYPPPFQKKDIIPLYPEIRKLRKYLTAIAAGLDMGFKQGGAEKKAACPGINNPWDPYEFQVPNPLSQRLDALLAGKNKNNATLIFYTLAVATTLDYLVNNENSWAYGSERPAPLFRSNDNSGSVEAAVDADALFQQSIQKKDAGEDGFVPEPLPGNEPPVSINVSGETPAPADNAVPSPTPPPQEKSPPAEPEPGE